MKEEAQVQAEANKTERAKEQICRDALTIQEAQKKFVAEKAKAEEKAEEARAAAVARATAQDDLADAK